MTKLENMIKDVRSLLKGVLIGYVGAIGIAYFSELYAINHANITFGLSDEEAKTYIEYSLNKFNRLPLFYKIIRGGEWLAMKQKLASHKKENNLSKEKNDRIITKI